ncbi:hypothetical protein, partial [Jiangella asiatica]|uniref:hypothetical protein n=1 Tax=Jiangella asiatica TaxID=2530372 RepID=UPI0013A5CBE9
TAVGLGLVTIGLTVVLALDLAGWLRATLLVVLAVAALVALVVLLAGVARVMRRGTRLVLDDDGFVNATGFGVRAERVPWRDVRKVQTDGTIVSVDLAHGRQSLIRTSAIDVEPRVLARELRGRLNRDRGYRPLSGPEGPF